MITPIIPGFYPDPSICRGPDAYYSAHSSFEYAPGVPIFRSTDLVTWTQIGNALTEPSQLTPTAGQANSGIYAPTIRYHDGTYWLITTNIAEVQQGQLVFHAESAFGPWSDPVRIPHTTGIDPDLCWDEDGVAHLTWSSVEPDYRGLATVPVDLTNGTFLAEPQLVWQGTGMQEPEGPHLYRIGEWWYLLIAEGGTERGHTVSVARAAELTGPWETPPVNPIFTHRSTAHPVQNVGHADLIETFDGDWAMVYHGVRPRGVSPKFHVNGRETFLAGIEWIDGWPVVHEDAYSVEPTDHSFTDAFDGPSLDPRWVAPGTGPVTFVTHVDDGVVIDAARGPQNGVALLGVRPRDLEWSFRAVLTGHGTGRVLVRMDAQRWYGVTVGTDSVEATLAIGPSVTSIGTAPRSADADVEVRVTARPAQTQMFGFQAEPDNIELAFTDGDGAEHVFGSYDGRYLSTEVAGGFTGRVVGIEAVDGAVHVRNASYRTDRSDLPRSGPDGSRYDLTVTSIGTLLNDDDARAILNELLPELTAHPFIDMIRPAPLDVLSRAGAAFDPSTLEQVRQRLARLTPQAGEAQ